MAYVFNRVGSDQAKMGILMFLYRLEFLEVLNYILNLACVTLCVLRWNTWLIIARLKIQLTVIIKRSRTLPWMDDILWLRLFVNYKNAEIVARAIPETKIVVVDKGVRKHSCSDWGEIQRKVWKLILPRIG